MENESVATSVYDRLYAFFDYVTKQKRMMRKDEFYEKTGITNGYFRAANKKIKDGGTKKDVNVGTLQKVLNIFPDANLEFFVLGKGEFFLKDGQDYQEKKVVVMSNSTADGRPYYDVDILSGTEILSNAQSMRPAYYINIPEFNRNNYIWVNMNGHSMHPLIQSGDKVCICEVKDFNSILYGEIYVIVTEDMKTVRYVCRSDNKDHIRLVPENKSPRYGDFQDIPVSCIDKMYRVVGSIRIM